MSAPDLSLRQEQIEPRETLVQYQSRRIDSIAEWHGAVGDPEVACEQDSSVRYLLLWATFNGLYNVLDMSKRKLAKPEENTGKPRLVHRGERRKLENVAKVLATEKPLLTSLLQHHRTFLQDVAGRRPEVSQPDEADEIHYVIDSMTFVFRPKEARGIASLDNRIILEDGHKVYECSTLTGPITKKAVLAQPGRFMRELVFVLYQIRNNVAHGGSAAFFSRGNKVADDAIAVLNSIVQHLIEHRELLVGAVVPAPGLAV